MNNTIMDNNLKIFRLDPLIQIDTYKSIIIWSDNETDARRFACPTKPAAPKGKSQITDVEEIRFYEDELNASCSELKNNTDYKVSSMHSQQGKDQIFIEYKGKTHQLEKNDPETLE